MRITSHITSRFGCIGLLMLVMMSHAYAAEQSQFIQTAKVLQERYDDEVIAHRKYSLYARQALREEYPNIAHLFRALSASEAIHAHNFKRILKQLGHAVEPPTLPELTVGKTKVNIREASTVEANEIDRKYPGILKSIEPEKHQDAIDNITYAWKSEAQHSEMIKKILKASKRWFGLLADHIEDRPTRYHVCHICGSTLKELPDKQCPICKHPVSHYQEVPGFPGVKVDEDDE